VPEIGPALVLSALVGVGWTAFFVVVRGTAGGRLLFVALVASIGAWAGDAIGGRLGLDPVQLGDYHLLAASAGAWAGIAFVILFSVLGPTRRP
jgi:hypothetical protein